MIKAVIFDMYETLITHYQCPLYFSAEMAADAGISTESFQARWKPTESLRTTGKMTFEEIIETILRENHCYSKELLHKITQKRIATKRECFRHLHPEIIPMLQELQHLELGIGLISNCFSEEIEPIQNSILFPYFDAPFLSYEQGIQKPEDEIFIRCMNALGVKSEECLYVGDGGSQELEVANRLGMQTVQAVWYLKEDTLQPVGRKDGFVQLEMPMDVVRTVTASNR